MTKGASASLIFTLCKPLLSKHQTMGEIVKNCLGDDRAAAAATAIVSDNRDTTSSGGSTVSESAEQVIINNNVRFLLNDDEDNLCCPVAQTSTTGERTAVEKCLDNRTVAVAMAAVSDNSLESETSSDSSTSSESTNEEIYIGMRLLCRAVDLHQHDANNSTNDCSGTNKRLHDINCNNTKIISSVTPIKKKRVYKRKEPCLVEGCTSLRRGGTTFCVRHGAKKYRSYCKHPGCNNYARIKGLCRRHHTQNLQSTNERLENLTKKTS